MARSVRRTTHDFHAAKLDAMVARGRSKKSIINTATKSDPAHQSIATPWRFIHALEVRFGFPVDFDLAATDETKKVHTSAWFGSGSVFGEDALARDWSTITPASRLAYCNPPFAHIKPWARKLGGCRWLPRFTCMLVPASYSATWFQELKGKVQIDAIPRIQFEGQISLYPKELVLITAGYGISGEGYWDWYTDYFHYCQSAVPRLPFEMPEVKATKRPAKPRLYLPDLHGTSGERFGEVGFQPLPGMET